MHISTPTLTPAQPASFIWYRYYALPAPLHDRDSVYRGTRKEVEPNKTFVLAYKEIQYDDVPQFDDVLRTDGIGGYVIQQKGKNRCQVQRYQVRNHPTQQRMCCAY